MKLNYSKPTIQALDKEVGKSRRITHVAFSCVVKGRITLDFSTTPPAPRSAIPTDRILVTQFMANLSGSTNFHKKSSVPAQSC